MVLAGGVGRKAVTVECPGCAECDCEEEDAFNAACPATVTNDGECGIPTFVECGTGRLSVLIITACRFPTETSEREWMGPEPGDMSPEFHSLLLPLLLLPTTAPPPPPGEAVPPRLMNC